MLSETSAGNKFLRILSDNGAAVALVAMVLAMAFLSPAFFNARNLTNIGEQAAVVALLAFGQTFVIVSGGIDLSVGSVAALSAVATGVVWTQGGLPGWLAVTVGILTGVACGIVSAIMINYGKLPAFIATLAMLSIGRGATLVLSGGLSVKVPEQVGFFGSSLGGIVPMPLLIMILLGIVTWFILSWTYPGRCMYAIGGNEEAARLSGINVNKQRLIIYALSGFFAAIAGIVLSGRLLSAQSQAAAGYELDAIAAVVIGGASLSGGKGRAFGTFVGALVLAVIRNGLNLLNVSAFWQQIVIGVVIALAVLTDTLRKRS